MLARSVESWDRTAPLRSGSEQVGSFFFVLYFELFMAYYLHASDFRNLPTILTPPSPSLVLFSHSKHRRTLTENWGPFLHRLDLRQQRVRALGMLASVPTVLSQRNHLYCKRQQSDSDLLTRFEAAAAHRPHGVCAATALSRFKSCCYRNPLCCPLDSAVEAGTGPAPPTASWMGC